MLDQRQGGEAAMSEGSAHDARYHRPMPGGGYVEIEVAPSAERESSQSRGRLIVERRSDHERRMGHQPPVVADVLHEDRDALMADLFELAHDNAALARRLLEWQSARARAD